MLVVFYNNKYIFDLSDCLIPQTPGATYMIHMTNSLTLWNPRATTVDSPPFCRPDHGRPESTQEFIIIVYLRLRNRMRYAWTSHLAIDINAHTRIGVCLTYNIAFE